MRLRQRDQCGDAGRVVDRAVADVVAGLVRRTATEVIPVRGVQHVFARPRASRQDANHVV